jgi:leucine dehydrogenase
METNHVTGLPESMGGGGDPSPVTAYGVYMGMKAAAKHTWGNDSLNGKKGSCARCWPCWRKPGWSPGC